jgi:putative tryptophan/tyrosine transport system substrate-binding protein
LLHRAVILMVATVLFHFVLTDYLCAQSTTRWIAVFTPGAGFAPVLSGFRQGLSRLGYAEGKNIAFIIEDTKGETTDLVAKAETLLAAKPELIFVVTTAHAQAAKRATTTVPVVFAWASEPVRAGLVASFSSSKNNLTGVMTGADAISGKRLELLLQVAPKAKRLLTLVSSKENIALSSFKFLETSATKLGVNLVRRDVASEDDIERALLDTPKGSIDTIYHIPSVVVGSHVTLLIEKAKKDRIPMVAQEESIAKKGALLTYGADFQFVGMQAARLAAKILKGGKPSDIPSETPERLLLVVNQSTAKAIGVKIPRDILEQADRIIE